MADLIAGTANAAPVFSGCGFLSIIDLSGRRLPDIKGKWVNV